MKIYIHFELEKKFQYLFVNVFVLVGYPSFSSVLKLYEKINIICYSKSENEIKIRIK